MDEFESIIEAHLDDFEYLERGLSLIDGDNPKIAENLNPRISYDLLKFNQNDKICFTSSEFVKEDFHLYFEKMVEVSKTKLKDLMFGNTNLDFKIYSSPNKKLKNIYFNVMNVAHSSESLPSFGRIGLYNSLDEKGKAPRIFFVVGHYATLHILACDPEHLIYGKER